MNSLKIKDLIKKKFKLLNKNDNLDLLTNGIIDSLNIVELVEFINKKLNLKCDTSKISQQNFSSINKILIYLKKNNKNIK